MWNRVKSLSVALILTVLLGLITSTAFAQNTEESSTNETIFTQIYEQVSPSVVSINVINRQSDTDPQSQDGTIIGGGTGFIIDNNGHILTNNHVVGGATEIEVNFYDGTLASASIIGLDPDSDLAVLQVDLPEEQLSQLQSVEFGDSATLKVGETVLAIGSPFGQRWTLTTGIVSALGRSIQGLTEFAIGGVIQTDAAINPGNSGGPLLNLDGQVIGVNTQIVSSTRSNAGVGFAIPGNLAQSIANELIQQGYVDYSYLGIVGGNVTLPLIEEFDIPNDTQGVVVAEVAQGGPASRAGLESATFNADAEVESDRAVPESVDIITSINDQPLSSIGELIAYLATETEPEQTVTLTVLRLTPDGSEEMTFDVVLTPRP